MLISSHNNPTIKQIRSLRERKEREHAGLFFVEGIRPVVEAAQLGARIQTLVVAPELLKSGLARQTIEEQRARGVPVLDVTPGVFESLSPKAGPQGIGAVVQQRWEVFDNIRIGNELCWVALDEPQDPGNVGTILRTADAVGCGGVILVDHSADPYDPASLRASMGAIFSQRLARANFIQLIDWKIRHGYTLVGTSDKAAAEYRTVKYPFPMVLLMGSEREGLTVGQQKTCDVMVRLPMVGRSDSLNLAVATGVMLYELFAQRQGVNG